MIGLVLDTDVVVAALRSSRGQAEHRLAAGVSGGDVDAFVNGVIGLAEP